MMGLMMDAFGWTAEQYWNATSVEIWSCIEARQRATEQR
jgi:hypothetical protein